MLPTIYKVKNIGSGFLAIMARPRVDDWVHDEFAGLRVLGVSGVVSLLEVTEARELNLESEEEYCSAASLTFDSFPISDRGVPLSVNALSKFACDIYHRCAVGKSIVIHCRAGIGRSGLVAAAVLMHSGISAEEAIQRISQARGVSVPDTDEQALWIEKNKNEFSNCYLD